MKRYLNPVFALTASALLKARPGFFIFRSRCGTDTL